jgi:hypothetical protein
MKIRVTSPYHNKRFVYEGSIEEWNQLLGTHIEESNISTLLSAVGLYSMVLLLFQSGLENQNLFKLANYFKIMLRLIVE